MEQSPQQKHPDQNLWYKDAIIYELHIKAFCDGDGDGTGDFTGLLEKLDYLESLGVTAIWLLPFYPSPLRDDGYDIADYYSINPAYGDIDQFKRFLDAAHKRNLKVITELVINHTSDQHPWFQRARTAPRGSVERDYYVWSDDPGKYKDVRIIFQDFEASNWSWDPVAEQYYWHRFFYHQPDLNYDNPEVQEEVFRMIDYWCQLGVDGFRLDAVPYLYEREGTNSENLPETHAFLKKLRRHVEIHYPATVFLAEANMWPEDSASYFGDGDECHMNYHFPVMPRIFMALRMEDRYPITDIFDQTPPIPANCQWAIFLRNHDELTLEMVTDEERDYMYKVYAKDPKARINLGIRHRLAPLMENNRRKIELLNCLLFSLKGTPVIYYGDEIGMGDNFYLGDRDGVRTPMQWSPDRNAGFSKANPQKLYLPLILDPEYSYESVNVETQAQNPSSLLWFMKRMINMRRRYKAFGRGDMTFVPVDNPKVLAFTRTLEDEKLLVVINLSKFSQPAELDLADYKGYQPAEIFSRNKFPLIKENMPYLLTLDAYTCEWFELEKTYEEDTPPSAPVLTIAGWHDLVSAGTREDLSAVLTAWLPKTPWFVDKDRTIYSLAVIGQMEVPMEKGSAWILLIEVNFESGLPQWYQLPLTTVGVGELEKYATAFPWAFIGPVSVGTMERQLCDALFCENFQYTLLQNMAGGAMLRSADANIRFSGNDAIRQFINSGAALHSRVVPSMAGYTAIIYHNNFFLKVYRQVETGINPDLEMTAYFTHQAPLPVVPPFAGSIEWTIGKEQLTLAMAQNLVEFHGNGSTFMLDRLGNLNDKILARSDEQLPGFELKGRLTSPVAYETLPENMREFLGAPLAEGARQIGEALASFHKALSGTIGGHAFLPENFSLHYQRSLYAGMQTLVRSAFDHLARNINTLPENVQAEARGLLQRKNEVLSYFKNIYRKKLDIFKIRIHGYLSLEQALFTGKDVSLPYLGGDPRRPFSERRLKRSPLRDVAAIVRSLHYVAQTALRNNRINPEDLPLLARWYKLWTHYATSFFMQAYLETADAAPFIPADKDDLATLLHIYLLEIALRDLYKELNNQSGAVAVPLHLILAILDDDQHASPGGQATQNESISK